MGTKRLSSKSSSLAATVAVLGTVAAWPSVAQGQETPSMSASSATGDALGEIVVTAQRRNEDLQKVPVAVTAITNEDIERLGLRNVDQIAEITSGITLQRANGMLLPTIRGVPGGSAFVGGINTIAFYIDGVYFSRLPSGVFALSNIEQVEVLKGPQGTLFGLNANGGVVNIRTLRPTHDLTARASLTYANADTVEGDAYASFGLSENVAMSLAVNGRSTGGYGKNLVTGNRWSYEDYFTARASLLIEPSERSRIILSGTYSYNKQNNQGNVSPGTVGGYISPPFARRLPLDNYQDTANDVDANVTVNLVNGSVKLEHDFDFATFSSTTAYLRSRETSLFDADFTERSDYFGELPATIKQFTQELQLSSAKQSRLKWVAGLFYFNNSSANTDTFFSSRIIPLFNPGFINNSSQKQRSYAAYGQISYEILTGLTLTGGLRYTEDYYRAQGEQIKLTNPITVLAPLSSAKGSTKKPSYKIAVDYELSRDALVYASYARGTKAGNFNLFFFDGIPLKPEQVEAYEVGFKSMLFDRRVRLNASLFRNDYNRLQVSVLNIATGVTSSTNTGAARSEGAEIEAQAIIATGLTARLSATYVESKFVSYEGAAVFEPNFNPPYLPVRQVIDASGNYRTGVPKFTMAAGLDYTFMTGLGEVVLSADYYRRSSLFFTPANTLGEPGYDLFGASARIDLNDHIAARVWGRNLTNEKHTAMGAINQATGFPYAAARPRTYGITVLFKN